MQVTGSTFGPHSRTWNLKPLRANEQNLMELTSNILCLNCNCVPSGGENHPLACCHRSTYTRVLPRPHPDERGGRTLQLYPIRFKPYFTRNFHSTYLPQEYCGEGIWSSALKMVGKAQRRHGAALKQRVPSGPGRGFDKKPQLSAGTMKRDLGVVYVLCDPLICAQFTQSTSSILQIKK